jgi:hypothetical protein
LIFRNVPDFPFADDWDQFFALSDGMPNLGRLFLRHNANRIVTARLVNDLLYSWTGFNFIYGNAVNYALALMIPVLIYRIAWRDLGKTAIVTLPFFVFFFSNAAWECDVWSVCLQWRFFLLFAVASVLVLFEENQGWLGVIGGSVFLLLSMYSFSAGVATSLAIAGVYAAFKVMRAAKGSPWGREVAQGAVILCVVVGGGIAWAQGYDQVVGNPPATLPIQSAYWLHLFNQLSSVIGNKRLGASPGMLIGILILVLLAGDLWKHGARANSASWRRVAIFAVGLASMSAITFGRAGVALWTAKDSRYFEVALILLPAIVMSGIAVLHGGSRWVFLIVFLAICSIGFAERWSAGPYRDHGEKMAAGIACVQSHVADPQPIICPTLASVPLNAYLREAERRKLSFYRKYLTRIPAGAN